MRNLILILVLIFFGNQIKGQDIISLTGKIEIIGNPCLEKICPSGLVWSLKADTASFVLTKNNNWIWADFSLTIGGIEYFENDSISIYGQVYIKQEWDGKTFYEFEIFDYDSIVNESKLWSVLSGGYATEMEECCYQTSFIKFEIDTLINTIDEKQVIISTDSLKTWTKIGNIKESDKKIYFRDLNNKQGLLYDFGASVGDIIKIVNYSQNIDLDTIVARVENIDIIDYFGIQRQRFVVQDTLGGQKDYWITGIGSIKGLLNPCIEIAGGFRELLCVFKGPIQIYQNEKRIVCYLEDVTNGIQKVKIKGINIYPNPATGLIIIDGINKVQGLELIIYNTIGQLMYQEKITDRIIQLDLNKGVYVFLVMDKGIFKYKQKLVIIE